MYNTHHKCIAYCLYVVFGYTNNVYALDLGITMFNIREKIIVAKKAIGNKILRVRSKYK